MNTSLKHQPAFSTDFTWCDEHRSRYFPRMPKLIKSKSLNLQLEAIFLGHFRLIIALLCHLPEALKMPAHRCHLRKVVLLVTQLLLPPRQIRPFTSYLRHDS